MPDAWTNQNFKAGKVFTPGAPISEQALFSGRISQIRTIINLISQTGYHAVLYGERGVGKTSLSNVLSSFIQSAGKSFHLPRVNCDARDSFTTLWMKLFKDLTLTEKRDGVGFTSGDVEINTSIVESLPDTLTPDDVRRVLHSLSNSMIFVPIFDEFDRIESQETCTLMADLIKALSDYSVDATIMIIGVADSVDELIKEHHSIERALVQIPIPRMSSVEVRAIIDNGFSQLDMKIKERDRDTIVQLSQGLPYITHLVALHASRSAIGRESNSILQDDVNKGVNISLKNWQHSIKGRYYDATKSPQPGNIFRQVVLACAFAKNDEFGYFSASNVRDSLRSIIPERSYDIPNFARHLKQLSGSDRGDLLSRTGKKGRIRYRFNSPLMRPYIVMRGFDDGTISRENLPELGNDGTDEDGNVKPVAEAQDEDEKEANQIS